MVQQWSTIGECGFMHLMNVGSMLPNKVGQQVVQLGGPPVLTQWSNSGPTVVQHWPSDPFAALSTDSCTCVVASSSVALSVKFVNTAMDHAHTERMNRCHGTMHTQSE